MTEPKVVVSPHGVELCVERVCRLAARPAYRVSQRRRVTDILLADLDLDREPSGRYAIRLKARCRRATSNPLGGRAFLTVLGRLSPLDRGTEMSIAVRFGVPFLPRDRMTQKVGIAVWVIGLAAWLIAAILTGECRLWGITGAYALTMAMFGLLARHFYGQATRAVTALLASAISAPVASQDETRITLSA